MKYFALTTALLVGSCTGLISKEMVFTDLVFISREQNIDVIKVEGLDLGKLYRRSTLTPKNVGNKAYATSQGISIAETITISWRYSGDREGGKIVSTKIGRIEAGVPPQVPEGYQLNLVFSHQSWTMSVTKN